MWKISPHCVSVYVFLNYKLGWIPWDKFHKWKISAKNVLLDMSLINEHDQTSSNYDISVYMILVGIYISANPILWY